MRSVARPWALLGLLLMMPVLAGAMTLPDVSAERLTALAEHPRWKALLHWNQGATLRSRQASYVADEAFFLSPDGRRDAARELIATHEALRRAGSPQRCRFPARLRFLAEQLGVSADGALEHCPDWLEWSAGLPDGDTVLVFPAAYLNSPSSMFGHTLMRLDARGSDDVWNSWAINFGAMVSSADNSIFYIYRGLAGGYDGYFSIVPYATKIQEYAHLENRDMWEYRLNLQEDERRWLVEHLWELQDIRFAYFFLDENCSFRLLELLEVARPGSDLLTELRLTEIPVDTVRAVDRGGFVADRRYRPSKSVELLHGAGQLSPSEQRLARRVAEDVNLLQSPEWQQAAPERRRLMAQTAYDYLRFRSRTRERTPQVASTSFALLREIRGTPRSAVAPLTVPSAPEHGHPTRMVALGAGSRGGDGFAEVGIRATYHDWLDNPTGFLRGAEIEALDLRLRQAEGGRLRVESLELFNIRSLAPRNVFMKPVSWRVTAGFERGRGGDRLRPLTYLEGGAGLSWRHQDWQPYLFLLARGEHGNSGSHWLNTGLGAEAGLLWHAPRWTAQLAVRGDRFDQGESRHLARLALGIPVNRRNSLRLSVERQGWQGQSGEHEVRGEWRHYFD